MQSHLSLAGALFLLPFGLSTIYPLPAAQAETQFYVKDASQFCFPKLSADDQIKYYSRIMNIGASYSHGCTGCDQETHLRSYTDLTNDQFWFRRNFLVHFLANVPWKQSGYGVADKIAILENDPKKRPTALIPQWSLERDGYTGEWFYDVRRDVAHLIDPAFSKWLSENSAYGESAKQVGGPMNVTDLSKPRSGTQKGSLYLTYRDQGPQDPNAPRIYDLAIDGARMYEFFSTYVSPDIIEPLEKSKWTDASLRKKAVEAAVKHVKSLNPSMILAIDALFWDSVSHAIVFMREAKPDSFIVRTLLNITAMTDKNGRVFNETRRFNVSQDFYKMLEGVSQSNAFGPSIPVIVGRMIDNPLEVFARKKYEPVLGAILGQFIATMTGQNFGDQLALWLRRMSGVSVARGLDNKDDYYDPETNSTYSAKELLELKDAYDDFKQLLTVSLEDYGFSSSQIPVFQEHVDLEKSQLNANLANPINTAKSKLISGLTNWAILKALKDLPLFMQSLERAMQHENRGIRALTSQNNNNTHLISVDDFLGNFPYFLKPEIMHPSVFGAKQMAGLINKAVCQSVGQQ